MHISGQNFTARMQHGLMDEVHLWQGLCCDACDKTSIAQDTYVIQDSVHQRHVLETLNFGLTCHSPKGAVGLYCFWKPRPTLGPITCCAVFSSKILVKANSLRSVSPGG